MLPIIIYIITAITIFIAVKTILVSIDTIKIANDTMITCEEINKRLDHIKAVHKNI